MQPTYNSKLAKCYSCKKRVLHKPACSASFGPVPVFYFNTVSISNCRNFLKFIEVSCGRHALGRGGTQTNSMIVVANGCYTVGLRDYMYVMMSDIPL
jgi:hypothetical protein